MGFGLRPGAKAPDEPPSPTGYAPPLDSTVRDAGLIRPVARPVRGTTGADGRDVAWTRCSTARWCRPKFHECAVPSTGSSRCGAVRECASASHGAVRKRS